ncbi:MAG: hypothetical protein SOY65_10055 [Marinifilaceae bacterium]|nr:hypothetical protein [Marinifilaceae bacterium]
MKFYWLSVVYVLFFCWGCYEEDGIHVTEGLEVSYSLPQGDHMYDETIMSWFEQYGFYPLYIFEDKDIYWANENWEERFEDGSSGGGSLKGTQADPNYVGEQLALFQTAFMEIYPDSLIAKYMPLKLLLCSELWNVSINSTYDWVLGEYITQFLYTGLWAHEGWDYIAINGGSQVMVDTMTVQDKEEFQAELNEIFLRRLYENGVLEIPKEFGEISNYDGDMLNGYGNDAIAKTIFAEGFVSDPVCRGAQYTREESIKLDFEAYLSLLAHSKNWLESTPPSSCYEMGYQYNYILLLNGVLHPTRDVNGLIHQKYDILMNMLRDKGINVEQLQYPVFD